MTETAYDRAMKQKLVIAQAEQRALKPIKIGQKIFGEWCQSFGAMIDVNMAADLVKRIEAAIVAERSALSSTHTTD